jgi:glycerophosphoryl diester phosphodiesterase
MARRITFDRPIAHRGLHDRARGIIENSRAAFEAAIARGFAIECDVQLSRDGVPMVFHDDDLARLTGRTGPVGSLTAADLAATPLLQSATGDAPLRFAEFLDVVAGRVLLQIEVRRQPTAEMGDRLAAAVVAALSTYAGEAVLESFDPHLLMALRRHGYKGPLGIITYDYMDKSEDMHLTDRERFALRHLLHWPWTRFSFISCYYRSLNLPAVKLFRALGLPVTAWTIASPAERQLAAAGADQIVFEGFDPDIG